jgi:hypothetical protein
MNEVLTIVSIATSADIRAQEGPLSALQQALVSRLQQDQRFKPFQILHENRLDIISEIDAAIAKLGLAITIMTPEARDSSPNIPVPIYDDVTIVAQVEENVLINRDTSGSRIPSGTVANWIAEDLKCTAVDGCRLTLDTLKQFVNESEGLVAWNVTLKLSLNQ